MEQEPRQTLEDFPTTEELHARVGTGDESALVIAREYYRKVVSVLTDIQHTVDAPEPPTASQWYEHFHALQQTKAELEALLHEYDPGYLE